MNKILFFAVGGLLLLTACSEEEENLSFSILVQDLQRNSATVIGTPPTAESETGKTSVYNDCGIYWSTSNSNPTDADNRAVAQPDANGNFRISMTDLKGATTYYVKGYARDYSKTIESDVISFTTPGGNPQFSARVAYPGECHVTISDLGGKEIEETGLCGVIVGDVSNDFMPDINNSMRKPQTPSWKDNDKTAFSMTIPFGGYVPGSYAKQTYYVRAYIITENGIGYSDRFSYQSFER